MKLKVAILEDNKLLLKDLKQNLDDTGFVDVVAWATNSEEFLEKVKASKAEALLLDIDLGGDSMNGLDIAENLKLPVLFVSGKTGDFYQGIADHNLNSEYTVEFITKPITIEKLRKILPKFISEIRALNKAHFVYLNFGDTRQNKISIDSIVCICTDKANGAESNNKQIFFTDRKHEILIDFSYSIMVEKGLTNTQFITIHKSFRVNADKILTYNKLTHEIDVAVFKSEGKIEIKKLSVSENYRYEVMKLKK